MGKVTWLHISDIHAGKDAFGASYFAANLDSFLRARKERTGASPDIIFFSGDIANTGAPTEYASFIDDFLMPLLEIYGDNITKNLVFVPGNHDVDRRINPLVEPHGLIVRRPQLFDTTSPAHDLRAELAARFKAFSKALPSQQDLESLFGEQVHFTREMAVNGVQIGIVGINTAWLCHSDQDKGQLTPGRYGIKQGLESISKCALRIVLGHHPVSWFQPSEEGPISALFAQHNVIYLHGHMHEPSAEYESRSASDYLNIQAGAAFDGRDSKERPHTILFGEFSSDQSEIVLEQFKWDAANHQWALSPEGMPDTLRPNGESRWHFPLPAQKQIKKSQRTSGGIFQIPQGWVEIDRTTVTKWTSATMDASQALSYFDGRAPNWTDAASIQIPLRSAVGASVNEILAAQHINKPSVHLLTGPGGEGKSTALRQICCVLLRREPSLRIIFRNDDDAPLPNNFVLNDLDTSQRWILVADEAANLAENVHFQSQVIVGGNRGGITYLIAARDTDWFSAGGTDFNWPNISSYHETLFRGISNEDAKAVVLAWSQYGKAGLQKLAGYSIEEAAQHLFSASLLEESKSDGAFLGAMLSVRYGKELRAHIAVVLERLRGRPSVSGSTLLEALSVVVALHRLQLSILTKEVFAKYLGCKETDVRKFVLVPLRDEAVVSVAGGYIMSRHREIANAAYELMETQYDIDFCAVYKGLVTAALSLMREGRILTHVPKWRFMAKWLFDLGEQELALQVAETVVSLDPGNTYLIVHLASLRRSIGRNDLALAAFRNSKITVDDNRGFFTEWAAAERLDMHYYAAVWLTALAIIDTPSRRDVTNEDAKMALMELCMCGKGIYASYNIKGFLLSAVYAQQLALKLPLTERERDTFLALSPDLPSLPIPRPTISQMVEQLLTSAKDARAQAVEDYLPSSLHGISFSSLSRLISATGR